LKEKIFAVLVFGILCLLILTGFARVSAQQASVDWSQYHGDSGHTGYTTDNGPITNNVSWKYSLGPYGKIESYSAAVADGLVYFSGVAGNLTCVNAATGALVWSFTTIFQVSSPAVANGLVYFSCDDGNVYCLNAQTGALVWVINSTITGFAIGAASTPAVSNGVVYFGDTWTTGIYGTTYANITCANATNGALVWGYGVVVGMSNYETLPAVGGGCVYFTDGVGNLDCVNASTGALIWSTSNNGMGYTPSVANGFVYYGQDLDFYCRNATTGGTVWNTTTGGANYAIPAIANGNVYFGSEDGNFYCLNAQTGANVWKYAVPSQNGYTSYAFSGSVSGNGYVYFGSNNANIYCLNAQTGTLVWQYATSISVDSLPAIYNGVLYIGSWDTYMYAFGASGIPEFGNASTILLVVAIVAVTSCAIVLRVKKPRLS